MSITINVDDGIRKTLWGWGLPGRNQCGRVESLAARQVKTLNPEYAEALRVLEALKLAANSLHSSVHIFSDARLLLVGFAIPLLFLYGPSGISSRSVLG